MSSYYDNQLDYIENSLLQGISPLKDGLSYQQLNENPFKLSPFKICGNQETTPKKSLNSYVASQLQQQPIQQQQQQQNEEFKLYHSNPKKAQMAFFNGDESFTPKQQLQQQLNTNNEEANINQKQQFCYEQQDSNLAIDNKLTAPDLEYPEQVKDCQFSNNTFSYDFDENLTSSKDSEMQVKIQEDFCDLKQEEDYQDYQQYQCYQQFNNKSINCSNQLQQQQQYQQQLPYEQQQQQQQYNQQQYYEIQQQQQYQQYQQKYQQQLQQDQKRKQSRVYKKKKLQNTLKLNVKGDNGFTKFDIQDVTTAHVPTNIMNLLIPYLLSHYEKRNITCLQEQSQQQSQCISKCKMQCSCINCESYKYLRKLKVSKRNKNLRNFKQIWKNKYLRLISEHYFLNQCAGELLAKKIQKNTNMIHRYSALMLIKKFVEGVREPDNFIKLL